MNTKGRKVILTYRLYTLKDKPSRVNKETKILSKYDVKIHPILGKSSPSVLDFYKVSSLSECEKSEKFSSTPSELVFSYYSTLSELVILKHIIFSSLSVLIKLY